MMTKNAADLSTHMVLLQGLALSITLLVLAACSHNAPAQPDTTSPTTSSYSKVSPRLQTAAQQLMNGESPSEFHSDFVHVDNQGRLQIYVYIDDFSPGNLATLTAYGLVDSKPSPSLHLVQGWMKPQDLERLASLKFVTRITPPHYAQAH